MLIEATFPNRVESRTAIEELLPKGVHERGVEIEAPPGTTVRYEGLIVSRGIDVAPVFQFVMEAGRDVAVGVVVAWIIGKFRGRADSISIDRREIDLDDEGQVRRIIEESIKSEGTGKD